MKLKFSLLSYSKILLHAAKYPGCHFGGYLIGSSGDGIILVEDILPICHGNPVGPVFELSGKLSSSIFRSGIIGYYFGNEICSDRSIPHYIPKIMTTISKLSGSGILVKVTTDQLLGNGSLAVEATLHEKFLECSCIEVETSAKLNDILDSILLQEHIISFSDFEAFMDNGADFMNPKASEHIQSLLR